MGCLASRSAPVEELGNKKEPNSAESILMRMSSSTSYICRHGSFRQDYEVVRVISPGEHRRVLEVKNKRSQEIFALKEILKATTTSKEAGELLKEIEILSKLTHPNLIKMKEMYEDKQKFYVITELMQGGELFDFILDSNCLSESTSASVMRQLLSAVCYCHQNSVVLRNIKPENILLSSRAHTAEQIQIKIVDFGMSTMVTGHRRLHKVIGTELYTAPEVFAGDYTQACDLWSLGAVLYVMLSGSMPFSAETSEELQLLITGGQYSLTDGHWNSVSDNAKNLIQQMLVVDPNQRITAEQALNHPWITAYHEVSQEDDSHSKELLSDLRKFQGEKKLKQALSGFIADRFASQEDVEEQTRYFEALDKDHSGTLTRDELIQGLSSSMNQEDAIAEVDNILQNLDSDRSQSIDYKEFLTAAAMQKKLLSKRMVEKAFDYLDEDHNGKLTVKELSALLGKGIEGGEKSIKKMIKEADKNGDGQLDLKEFTSFLLQQ